MGNEKEVFCWHHSDKSRLCFYLSKKLVDCPREKFLNDHGLKPGDKIRFSVKVRNQGKGQIWAVAELVSKVPYRLQNPKHKDYPFAVSLINIKKLDGTSLCGEYPYPHPPPMNKSHEI